MVLSRVISNPRTRRRRFFVLGVLSLAIALGAAQLSSCASPAYYWQAASGHLSLMHARQPVNEVIDSADTDQATVEKLKLSREIKAFAVEELGLPDNGSYDEFVRTGQDAVVWNVVAAPEFSLQPRTWCFPVSGCVPYRGYFDQADANRFAEKLRNKDLDVAVSPAIAYSTLGWFEDPLLDTMWRHSEAQFAAYLFHELAHQKLYVKGDAAFNEAYASFVDRIGVERWLGQRGEREALEHWLALSEASGEFNDLLRQTRDELQAVYASDATPDIMRSAKQAAYERLKSRYRQLREQDWQGTDWFGGWFSQPPNNARFALLETYQGGTCAFGTLYTEAGHDIARFHELASAKAALPADMRRQWLETPCPEIAPATEL